MKRSFWQTLMYVGIALILPFCLVIAQPQRPDTAWVRVVGEGEVYESCMGVFETPDGGIITCGTLQDGPEGAYYGIFHRLDSVGNVMWSRRSLGIYTYVNAGLLRSNHVLIVAGTDSEIGGLLLAALDMNGDTLWTSVVLNGPSEGRCIARTANGRYAVGGDAPSSVTDAAITFFDSSGHYLHCRIYPDSVNPPFFSGWIRSITALEDSGLVFVADVFLGGESWLARLDSQGDTVWIRIIQSDTATVSLSSVVQLADGTILYGGYAVSRSLYIPYIFLGKLDLNGTTIWDSVYTLPFRYVGSYQDLPLATCADGGWIISVTDRPASMYDYARLLRFNALGDTLWSWSIGEEGNDNGAGVVTTLSDGGFAMAGANWDYDPFWRIWTYVMKTEPEESGVSDRPSITPDQFVLESVYPNPFNATATIAFTLKRPTVVRLRLYDVLGRLAAVIYDGWTPAGQHRFPLHASNLASGEYFLHAEARGVMLTRKIVLLK